RQSRGTERAGSTRSERTFAKPRTGFGRGCERAWLTSEDPGSPILTPGRGLVDGNLGRQAGAPPRSPTEGRAAGSPHRHLLRARLELHLRLLPLEREHGDVRIHDHALRVERAGDGHGLRLLGTQRDRGARVLVALGVRLLVREAFAARGRDL